VVGELYASRVLVEQLLADGPPEPVGDEDDQAEDDDEVLAEDQPEPWQPSEPDPDPDVQPDIDDPLPEVEDFPLGERPVKKPREEALAMFETRLRSLQESGVRQVTAADVVPVAREAGYTAQWAYKQLGLRVESGHLERTDDGWRFARALTPA
jgi:hypothetical protein